MTDIYNADIYTRDEYTHEWDGTVPVAPRVWDTPEEVQAHIDQAPKYGATETDMAKYGAIVHRTRTVIRTEWTPVK